jgi:hypothetical protein
MFENETDCEPELTDDGKMWGKINETTSPVTTTMLKFFFFFQKMEFH